MFTAPESIQLVDEYHAEGDYLYYEIECKVAGDDWGLIGQVHFTEGEQIFITDSDNSIDIS